MPSTGNLMQQSDRCLTPPQVDHLKQPENMKLLEDAKVVYSAGFFVTVSPESIYTCAQHCLDEKKIYCMVRSLRGLLPAV